MADFGNEFKRQLKCQELKIKELESYNRSQESIMQSFAGIYWWKDKKGVYKNCNKKLSDSLGLGSVEDIIGKTDYAFFCREEADALVHHDTMVMESGEVLITEESVREKNGELKVFLVTKSPLKNEWNEIIGTIGNSVDITKQKELEKNFKEFIKKSDEANLAKTEFIANMSHDLSTPMAGLLGMLENLGHEEEDARASLRLQNDSTLKKLEKRFCEFLDKTRACLSLAIESGRKISEFHSDILTNVELQFEGSKEVEVPFNLDSATQHILTIKKITAVNKKLGLSVEINPSTPCYLIGFKLAFQRVLLNIIGNAIKFTEEGSIKVTIGLAENTPTQGEHAGDKVILKIEIKDTGTGIPSDKFNEIFNQFTRLTSSYNGVYKGLGLGLYSAKKYIENMQGTIRVESKMGEGSCFTVFLPFVVEKVGKTKVIELAENDGKADRGYEQPEIEAFEAIEKNDKNARKVLLVEDDKIVALATRSNLSKLGYEVDWVQSGEAAIKKACKEEYALIFMDIGLPEISGVEAAAAIRQLKDQKKAEVPIVALTGHARGKIRKICLNAGMQGVYSKPTSVEDLKKALDYFSAR